MARVAEKILAIFRGPSDRDAVRIDPLLGLDRRRGVSELRPVLLRGDDPRGIGAAGGQAARPRLLLGLSRDPRRSAADHREFMTIGEQVKEAMRGRPPAVRSTNPSSPGRRPYDRFLRVPAPHARSRRQYRAGRRLRPGDRAAGPDARDGPPGAGTRRGGAAQPPQRAGWRSTSPPSPRSTTAG